MKRRLRWIVIAALAALFVAALFIPSRPWSERLARKVDEILQPRRPHY
jgi:hypothetical protein